MDVMYTGLCVGGPLDGKKQAPIDAKNFHIPILPRLSVWDAIPGKMNPVLKDAARIEYAEYTQQMFRLGDTVVFFYVENSMPILTAFMRLLEFYKPEAGKE